MKRSTKAVCSLLVCVGLASPIAASQTSTVPVPGTAPSIQAPTGPSTPADQPALVSQPPAQQGHAALPASVVTPPDYVEVVNGSDLTFFGWLITVVVGASTVLLVGFTGLMGFFQHSERREVRERMSQYDQKVANLQEQNARQEIENKIKEIELRLAKSVADQKEAVRKEIQKIEAKVLANNKSFMEQAQKDYQQEILAYVQAQTEEVLRSSPKAQDLMMAVMRRLADAIAGAEDLSALARPLNLAVQEWRTLGRLYYRDEKEIRNGLLEVRAHPFPEAKRVLDDLKLKYSNDMALYPEILDAIKAVEEGNRENPSA